MKVLFCNKLNRLWLDKIEGLRREFLGVDFVTDRRNVDSEIENADAIVGGELSLELVKCAKKLGMIFVPYAGVNTLPLGYIKAGLNIQPRTMLNFEILSFGKKAIIFSILRQY